MNRTELTNAELYRLAAQDVAGRGLFRSAELYLDLYRSALGDVGRDPVEIEVDVMFEELDEPPTVRSR